MSAAAAELTDDAAWRERLGALPWRGETVVAVGDSITADLQSWARILEAALGRVDAHAATRLVNLGLDGDTSAGVLARLPAILAHRPAHVLIMIGTNDGQGHAENRLPWLSDEETQRNLAAIGTTLAAHGASVTWLVPPRMRIQDIERHWYLGDLPIGWSPNRHEAKRQLVLRQPGGASYDAARALGDDEGALLDGLHPSLAGHRSIAAELVNALGA